MKNSRNIRYQSIKIFWKMKFNGIHLVIFNNTEEKRNIFTFV